MVAPAPSEPKIIPRKLAIGLSVACALMSALSGYHFQRTLAADTVPASQAARLIYEAGRFEEAKLSLRPQEKLPQSLLYLLGTAVSGGAAVLLWPKYISRQSFTPVAVQRLAETKLLPYSPTEAREKFVDFFVGLAADYPYLTKMMGSNLIIVNGPSGSRKSRTACCFALMQWLNPKINRTPYVLDAKRDINAEWGTWQGIPTEHRIVPSQFQSFWERIQKQKNWCIIIDEIDEAKNAGLGDVISQIVRVSNTQPRKQNGCVIIVAHGDEANGTVELTKDNLGLTDQDKGKINPVRTAANILTLGSYEDDFGQLQPTYQGTWKPGMAKDSQLRKITLPRNLDPSTFERYVLPFLEQARQVIETSPVVADLEDKLTNQDTYTDLVAKFEKAYLSEANVDHEHVEAHMEMLDELALAFLHWHFAQYGRKGNDPQPRRPVLTHFTYKGQKLKGEQVDVLFQLLEEAGILSQSETNRGKKLYTVHILESNLEGD